MTWWAVYGEHVKRRVDAGKISIRSKMIAKNSWSCQSKIMVILLRNRVVEHLALCHQLNLMKISVIKYVGGNHIVFLVIF